ncbi:MAG: polysaccharide deacetylase family protein [Anaerolineales bacterium]|nr:polysaccharide deacetylase family protein [Anaerolineales bacterium]
MNPISIALKGKGLLKAFRRAATINQRYGINANKLDRVLAQYISTLAKFKCHATFPIPAIVLRRHAKTLYKYQESGAEFAVHGYAHVDHSQLSLEEHTIALRLSRQTWDQHGIIGRGFRGPYLRYNAQTLEALRQERFSYDSSQALYWPVPGEIETAAYLLAREFYRAFPADSFPSLPGLEEGLVRIPYSLPDDEALVERLALQSPEQMREIWLAILQRTYDSGELFTLGLHPERFLFCREALIAVLEKARQLEPKVWIARLDEIDRWWRARSTAIVALEDQPGAIQISVSGPEGLTVLARSVEVDAPTDIWANGYRRVIAASFSVACAQRPFIGIHPGASSALTNFLQQQGYIIEVSDQKPLYTHYIDWIELDPKDQRSLLSQIEGSDRPLVRFGRWPDGAHSALSITGDIDALTVLDYGLRFLGK